MASPAQPPQPPPRSPWHDWWKFPVFFGVLAGALVLEAYSNSKGGVLLLLLLGYAVVRATLIVVRLFRKT